MNIQKKILNLEKRVGMLIEKPVTVQRKKASLSKFGTEKSKKELEDEINRIVKEYGGTNVHEALEALIKKLKKEYQDEIDKILKDGKTVYDDVEALKKYSKKTVNLRKHGWFHTKSKKVREVAIDKAIKEYGVKPVFTKARNMSNQKLSASNAYREAMMYLKKRYQT